MRPLLFLLFFTPLFGQELIPSVSPVPPSPPPEMAPGPYRLTVDIDFSPFAGGDDLLFGQRVVEKLEMALFGKSGVFSSKGKKEQFWRLTELFSFWLPLNYFSVVVQHEVFGHGYRLRDLGSSTAQVQGYGFDFPPPYGSGGGVTYFSYDEALLTSSEASAISSGGVESTAILAQLTKQIWLQAGRIDPRQAILYLLANYDLPLYIASLAEEGNEDGHDISAYIDSVNLTYPSHLLTQGELKGLAWISLADPFTYYAIFSLFHYISSGKETPIPMIGSVYLPSLRLGLTPFGPEVFLDQYILSKRGLIYTYLRGGYHADNGYFGAGFFAPDLWKKEKWRLGMRGDLWYQPKLQLEPGSVPLPEATLSPPLYSPAELSQKVPGIALSLLFTYGPKDRYGWEVELGGKTKGFLPGYSLWAAPTARISYALKF